MYYFSLQSCKGMGRVGDKMLMVDAVCLHILPAIVSIFTAISSVATGKLDNESIDYIFDMKSRQTS